jgi:hypothetical protein
MPDRIKHRHKWVPLDFAWLTENCLGRVIIACSCGRWQRIESYEWVEGE